jgi:hypothetical protein
MSGTRATNYLSSETLDMEVADALESARQQDQALRSRVQAVSMRRRPSDDESARSSLVSHHSFASAASAPASDWLLRGRKTATTGLSIRLAKQPSFREQFDEDRCSLPALENYQAEETSKNDVTPLAQENASKRSSWKRKDKEKQSRNTVWNTASNRSFKSSETFDVYYSPQSPVPSTVHSVQSSARDKARPKSGASLVSVDMDLLRPPPVDSRKSSCMQIDAIPPAFNLAERLFSVRQSNVLYPPALAAIGFVGND